LQAPIHDVPTAAEVLETGGYRSLPAAIEQLRPAPPPPAAERAAALRLMDQMLRARLLQVCGHHMTAVGPETLSEACAAGPHIVGTYRSRLLISCNSQIRWHRQHWQLGAPHLHTERSHSWLQEALPAGLQVLRVRAGVAALGSPALFEARLMLVPAPDQDAVLARCGACSGPASSPAPSGAATVQVSLGNATRSINPLLSQL
jgi:Mediator complex subunit MED14